MKIMVMKISNKFCYKNTNDTKVVFMSSQTAKEVTDIFVYQVLIQKILKEVNEPDLSLRDKKIILSRALKKLAEKMV